MERTESTWRGRRRAVVELLEDRRLLAGATVFAIAYGQEKMYDWASDVARDADGNIYIAGTFQGRMDVDPGPRRAVWLATARGDDETDAFVAKYSPAGRLLWARRFGGPNDESGDRIRVGPDGSVFVSGVFEKASVFSAGGRTVRLKSNGDLDAWIARLSPSGRLIWAGSIGGGGDDFINTIAVGADRSLFIAGTVRLAGDIDPGRRVRRVECRGVDDTFVSRIRYATGDLEWFRIYGEGDTLESVHAMAADDQGGVFVAGSFYRRVQFDRGDDRWTRKSTGRTDVYLGRLDADGQWAFLTTFGGSRTDAPAAMARMSGGDVVLTGNFARTADFDPGADEAILESQGDSDVFVARYTEDGRFVWAGQLACGDDAYVWARGLAVDAADNVYVSGSFHGPVDFDPGPRARFIDADKSGDAGTVRRRVGVPPFSPLEIAATDAFVVKLDGDGVFRYARRIGGRDGGIVPYGMAVEASGGVAMCGAFMGRVDLDAGPARRIHRTARERGETRVFLTLLE